MWVLRCYVRAVCHDDNGRCCIRDWLFFPLLLLAGWQGADSDSVPAWDLFALLLLSCSRHVISVLCSASCGILCTFEIVK